jgi:SAM-dependent methyltransferase
MTQNIYDDEVFFQGYSRLARSVEGLDGAPEWPALRGLLPDLGGQRVLDLGCGFGRFCRWAREQGAAAVLGIDVSEKMLTRASEATRDPAIAYTRADMERLELPPDSFDLVYSSLALHYVEKLDRLMAIVTDRSFRAGVQCSRWSIRSLPRPPSRAGRSMPRAARHGRIRDTPRRGMVRRKSK